MNSRAKRRNRSVKFSSSVCMRSNKYSRLGREIVEEGVVIGCAGHHVK